MSKKVLNYIIALTVILCLNFLLPRLLPGDPLSTLYGDEALICMTDELKADITSRFGLDKSLPKQFIHYIGSLFKGDLGYSYSYNDSVLNVIMRSLPYTLLLVGLALIISTISGFILGLESGWNYGNIKDKSFLIGFMLLNGFPDFFIGIILLIIFAVTANIFPLSGAFTPYSNFTGIVLVKDFVKHLILPLMSLIFAEITACYLLSRTTVVSILGEQYILTAKAKGLKEKRIKFKHVGKNSLLPILTRTGIRAGKLITGALFIEIVFAYPGIGLLIYDSLLMRDYPMIQGIFLLVAVGVLSFNFVVDLTYKKIDPRVI